MHRTCDVILHTRGFVGMACKGAGLEVEWERDGKRARRGPGKESWLDSRSRGRMYVGGRTCLCVVSVSVQLAPFSWEKIYFTLSLEFRF